MYVCVSVCENLKFEFNNATGKEEFENMMKEKVPNCGVHVE